MELVVKSTIIDVYKSANIHPVVYVGKSGIPQLAKILDTIHALRG